MSHSSEEIGHLLAFVFFVLLILFSSFLSAIDNWSVNRGMCIQQNGKGNGVLSRNQEISEKDINIQHKFADSNKIIIIRIKPPKALKARNLHMKKLYEATPHNIHSSSYILHNNIIIYEYYDPQQMSSITDWCMWCLFDSNRNISQHHTTKLLSCTQLPRIVLLPPPHCLIGHYFYWWEYVLVVHKDRFDWKYLW